MIAEYIVTGMTCEHCVAHVKEEVSAIPGVTDVALALADGQLTVTSAAPIDIQTVVAAVAEAGEYQVAPK
ncbi:MAG: heavy-metal-associated domain-containing protein [Propionibacteriaceae bacterium]|jgi:copper chaperone CopZ|nr:heavy-metal-associated domain-containing protein [Propionibacteriaceae bacterium]